MDGQHAVVKLARLYGCKNVLEGLVEYRLYIAEKAACGGLGVGARGALTAYALCSRKIGDGEAVVGAVREELAVLQYLADVHYRREKGGCARFKLGVARESAYAVDDLLLASALKNGHTVLTLVLRNIAAYRHSFHKEGEYLAVYIIYSVTKLL